MLQDLPWGISLLIIIFTLFSLFAIGMPIGFAMVFVSVVGLILTDGLDPVLNLLTNIAFSRVIVHLFIAIPLFVLMSELLLQGGMSSKLIDIAQKLMGRIPGSLAVVTIVASTVFGAMCASTVLGAMVMGETLLPETTKRDYDKKLISGALAAGDTLSILIPPSGFFILWGIIAGVNIGDLFIAGIIPGIVAAIMFILYIVIKVKRNPTLAPMVPAVSWREKVWAVAKGWDIVLFIIILLGGIYRGVATVAEIGAVGVVTVFILGLAHRSLNFSKTYFALKRTVEMIASVMLILIGAYLFIYFLNYLEIPDSVSNLAVDRELTALQLVIVIQLIFLMLGFFIEASSVMLFTLPLFLPALRELDVDLLWLGVVITINSMIASLTPPVGFSLFIIQAVGRPHGVNFIHVARGVIPYVLLLLCLMVLVFVFPSLVTWLPSTMD